MKNCLPLPHGKTQRLIREDIRQGCGEEAISQMGTIEDMGCSCRDFEDIQKRQ